MLVDVCLRKGNQLEQGCIRPSLLADLLEHQIRSPEVVLDVVLRVEGLLFRQVGDLGDAHGPFW